MVLREELPRGLGVEEREVGVQDTLPPSVDMGGRSGGIGREHGVPFLANKFLLAGERGVRKKRQHVDSEAC